MRCEKILQLRAIIRYIRAHPLARRHPLKAFGKLLSWQLGCLVNKGLRKVKFTDRTFLVAKRGMVGATGNIYMGLHEFDDMGFLLHFIRKGDCFFDIGANVGSYTILASGHIGAISFSFEPIPSTFNSLKRNISENGIEKLVKAFNMGMGARNGELYFTTGLDSINHVLLPGRMEPTAAAVAVDITSVDQVIAEYMQVPVLIKIDVEGFEAEVLKGMQATLSHAALKGIIIELNGSGERYGYSEQDIHETLLQHGFHPYLYNPFSRVLEPIEKYGNFNTIYIRDISFVRGRIESAEMIHLFAENF